jgi:hypothetical protein
MTTHLEDELTSTYNSPLSDFGKTSTGFPTVYYYDD